MAGGTPSQRYIKQYIKQCIQQAIHQASSKPSSTPSTTPGISPSQKPGTTPSSTHHDAARDSQCALTLPDNSICSTWILGLTPTTALCRCFYLYHADNSNHQTGHLLQDLLLHQLGAAVWAACVQGTVLCQGHLLSHTIHRAAAAEHQLRSQHTSNGQAACRTGDTGCKVRHI